MKPKDYVTCMNIVCGFGSMTLAFKGMLEWAAALVIAGYVFDVLDGVVARLTGGGNKFGAELDNVADLVTYSVAPAVVAMAHYDQWTAAFGHATLGVAVAVGLFPLICGCIRYARFNVKRIEYPGVWFGLPRPVSGMAIVAFLSSGFFSTDAGHYAGLAIVPFISLLNIGLWPVIGHHNRKFPPMALVGIGLIPATCLAGIPLGMFWDVLMAWTIFYATGSWMFIPKDERARMRAFLVEWKKGDG